MAQLKTNVFVLKDHPKPYMVLLGFPFNQVLQFSLKNDIPGCSYAGDILYGHWQGPIEMLPQMEEKARRYGLEVLDRRTPQEIQCRMEIEAPDLYPFQREAVNNIISDRANRARMIAFDMGLGKTPTAIVALRTEARTCLIIAPASVRLQWASMLDTWWPGHPEIGVIEKSADVAKFKDLPFLATSYELCYHFKNAKFDAVIVDESHAIANRKAARAKAVRAIMDNNLGALRLLLTGTPIMNEVWQLWHQLDTLWPGRVGTFSQFCERYTNIGSNDYSAWIPTGVNPRFSSELQARLATMCDRATKQEWEHLLPPFVLTPLRVRTKKKINPREILAEFTRMDAHNATGMDKIVRGFADDKARHAAEFVQEAMTNIDHMVVLTHLKATGMEIAALLTKHFNKAHEEVEIFYFDGDVGIRQRNKAIEDAKTCKRAVLVATMHSVKEGINSLVDFDQALLAEMYWSPGLMAQVLGRFQRLNGSCNVTLMIMEGTHEEMIAQSLIKKMGASRQVLKASANERDLNDALQDTMSEEEEFALLQEIVAEHLEEEYL